MNRCRQCPAPVEAPQDDFCPPCAIELAHRVMAAEPEPATLKCTVCGASYSLIEARVLRRAKDPRAKNSHQTPNLCWVCAHLHLSALRPEIIPPMYF